MEVFNKTASTARLLAASLLLTAAANAQLAKGDCKYLGNILSGAVPSDYNTYWNQASPENAGKWGTVEAVQGQYVWTDMDIVQKWAKSTGNPYKYHCLVWGGQQPSWVSTLAQVTTWFDAVSKRYPDANMIDVVNEAFPGGSYGGTVHAPAPYRGVLSAQAKLDGITGEFDWIFEAFKMARSRWPKAILIYNDYNTIEYKEENAWVIKLAQAAKAQNIPIDAIGCQAHDAFKVATATVKSNIDAIAAVGFPIYITEYDIQLTDDTQQKNVMAEQMPMFWNDPNVKGVTYWGLREGQTWRTGTGIFTSSGALRPSMQWLKDWIPSNKGVCGTTSIEPKVEPTVQAAHDGLVVHNIDGRLVTGIERDGQFQAVTALGVR